MELERIIAETELPGWVFLSLFLLTIILQLVFYLGSYTRLATYRPKKHSRNRKGVSVIICARNEADMLERNLPLILEQDYPEYEVIVVNDRSEDHTEELLMEMSHKHGNLNYTTLPANQLHGRRKKLALTIGLKSARYERVLLTDADCIPAGNQWLKLMTSHFSRGKDFVLGYGRYEAKKGFLNLLIRYETVLTAIQYLSSALNGKPYMGVGRNLAYNKHIFFQNKGFSKHYHLPSGDDDIFVNAHAKADNTAIEIHPDSHTISQPETSFRSWIRQKQRHLTAGAHYSARSKIRLGIEITSRLAIYPLALGLCVFSGWLWPVLCLFMFFLITRMIVFKLGMMRLNEKYLLLPSLLFDPLLPLALGIFWLRGRSKRKHQQWS